MFNASLFCLPLAVLVAGTAPTIAVDCGLAPLQNGRCMQPITVGGARLSGKAPQEAGQRYGISNGEELLWQGGAGESFDVAAGRAPRLYLHSSAPLGEAPAGGWQELRWQGEASAAAAPPASRPVLEAAAEGLLPGEADAGPALRQLLAKAREVGAAELRLAKGSYHFYPQGGLRMSCYVSNHDQQDDFAVAVPIVGQKGLKIDAGGAEFIIHGDMQPFLLMDNSDISLAGLSIRYAEPYDAEGKIVSATENAYTLEFAEGEAWEIRNGCFCKLSGGEPRPVCAALAFLPNGHMRPSAGSGDIIWPSAAEKLDERHVRFPAGGANAGLEEGLTLVLRHYGRPHPAMLLYRCKNSSLEKVFFHDTQGMALLAQRCENLRIRGGGCVPRKGFMHSSAADATHFSNCKGLIDVEGAHYAGMMDDAINVHSTCLSIEKVLSPREILCRYMHPQAVGFEVFETGEELAFIHGKRLENAAETRRVLTAERLNERQLRLTLSAPLPEGIGKGDAVENADWQPAVRFCKNLVENNRARGALFTSPRPVRVEGNRFLHGHGSAILLAGDAQGWYESGRCRDVIIRNNLFDHCLTARYQFTEGIISIYPEIKAPEQQKERYHENILICDNVFRTHRVPLLFAISAKHLVFRNNRVIYDAEGQEQAPSLHGGKPLLSRFCEDLQFEMPPRPPKPAAKQAKP